MDKTCTDDISWLVFTYSVEDIVKCPVVRKLGFLSHTKHADNFDRPEMFVCQTLDV